MAGSVGTHLSPERAELIRRTIRDNPGAGVQELADRLNVNRTDYLPPEKRSGLTPVGTFA